MTKGFKSYFKLYMIYKTLHNSRSFTDSGHYPKTEDPTRPFACPICPKRFRMKHHLKVRITLEVKKTFFIGQARAAVFIYFVVEKKEKKKGELEHSAAFSV